MGTDEVFPRDLSPLEQKLLLWVLPAGRPGYAEIRNVLEGWEVAGAKPWAEGTYVLAPRGSAPELDAPSPQLIAVGMIETSRGSVTVSVRELQFRQLEFEISGPADEVDLNGLGRLRTWTLSLWSPSLPCPSCGRILREVAMSTTSGRELTLALCAGDQRLWVYDESKQMNYPIPVTGFYNELMLQAKIQDPGIALQSRRLFSDLDKFADEALTRAFEAYNRTRNRLDLGESFVLKRIPRKPWLLRLREKILG